MKLPDLVSVTGSDGKRYYTTPSGVKLPSVTTVVGAMKKASIMEWRNAVGAEEANRVSRAASGRGNRVHNLAEKYLKNEPISWIKEMPDSTVMFRSLIPHMERINNIHYIEQALWSETIGMAGRVDLIAEWDGVLHRLYWM
jgi:genome maintenance exonuclease 1